MTGEKDYYSLLGIPRNATTEQIRRAYREAALRLHPDTNIDEGATNLFIEVGKAYSILNDQKTRAKYDQQLAKTESDRIRQADFVCKVQQSRESLVQLGEPQVHYILLDIQASQTLPDVRPPVNLCIVIDRSTSMRGPRLDKVRNAAITLIKGLEPGDKATIVAFSDRAELVVSPDQACDLSVARARLSFLQAGGGTEIGQGLDLGIKQLQESFLREGVNHLILLTDGRTYGDEELCLSLSNKVAKLGITINAMGIGTDWNDHLLDELASITGGNVFFLDSPQAVSSLLQQIFSKLKRTIASQVQIDGSLAQQVDLRSAFRLEPDPMPLGDQLPIILGHLERDARIRLILELVVHAIGQISELTLAHFIISGDVIGGTKESHPLPLPISIKASNKPDLSPTPEDITSALNMISLYQMQEKARHESELGQSTQAARRLENLATQLLAAGERELAKSALLEAARVMHSRKFSNQGEKVLKYGTRSLLLPAKTESS